MNIQDYIGRYLGVSPEGHARVRLGRGVVGNTTYALWAVGATIVGVSWALRTTPEIALIADGGLLLIYLIYLIGTYLFANKHPDLAMGPSRPHSDARQ